MPLAPTERIIKAVQNPHAHILGHTTGRLLLARPGYPVDLDAIIAACAESGTIIEINANPQRLDLDPTFRTPLIETDSISGNSG